MFLSIITKDGKHWLLSRILSGQKAGLSVPSGTRSQLQNGVVQRGLGAQPQQAKKDIRSHGRMSFFRKCINTCPACYYYTEFGTIVVIPRKILYRVSRRKADGTRGSALKTRYNKLGRNTPKPLPAKAGRDKTRYNIQSWFHGKIDREPILFMLNRCNIWTVAWFTWEIAPLIIIPSFVPMELLQQSMIVLEFYLLYRVFAIETLVVQGIHFKTRYNFFLGITAFVPNSAQC